VHRHSLLRDEQVLRPEAFPLGERLGFAVEQRAPFAEGETEIAVDRERAAAAVCPILLALTLAVEMPPAARSTNG
jgi:hypothetical protein